MTNRRILFVDDDQNILQGLQRMLRGMRHEWDMYFVDSGDKALAHLDHQPFDAIVSDMRMPGMDGAELLNRVRSLHPGMVRVILSGYSEEESIMRTVGAAHQYLAKPCEAQVLVDVIRRALELRRMLDNERLRQLLSRLKSLPTPSNTYFSLVKYMDLPQASANGVADIIARDVAMTAELLKLTNSAYFTVPVRVTSPLQAIRILGFETLRALVLRVGIFRSFHGNPQMGRLMEDLNRDSFLVARIARRIGKLEGFEPRRCEAAFCAGMLGTIGLLVLLDHMAPKFAAVKTLLAGGRDLLEAETEVFGATHLQVGAYLLGLWGFNQAVVEAVALSGRPSIAEGASLDVVGVVHVARVLAGASPAYAGGGGGDGARLALDSRHLEQIGMTDRLSVWTAEADAEKRA
jgi:HD-like signal output (HDOD) protein/CheY-like chemotaxis protein